MTSMNSEVYDALIDIGVSGERARKAAESMSSSQPRFDALDRKIDRLDANLNAKIDRLDVKVDLLGANLNAKINDVQAKLERKIDAVDANFDLLKWMFGILVAGVAALILKAFSH